MDPRDSFISWLKDAHSMENNVIQTLEGHMSQAASHPHLQTRMREHIEESRRHANLVESCLARYNESTSIIKEAIGGVSGLMQGITSAAARDNMVKNVLAEYAAEHMEIASYTSLMAAARMLGDEQTASICAQIISDEERMAEWLEQQIPSVTQMFLGEQASEVGR